MDIFIGNYIVNQDQMMDEQIKEIKCDHLADPYKMMWWSIAASGGKILENVEQ